MRFLGVSTDRPCYFAVLADIHLERQRAVVYQWDRLLFSRTKNLVLGSAIEERLEKTVDWINSQPFVFVVVLGDITESALAEQFVKAAQIFSRLNAPLISLIGNHDRWPYRQNKKKVVWQDDYLLTLSEFEDYLGHRWKFLLQPEAQEDSDLQNYAFVYKGVRFVIVDNVNRRKALPPFPGVSSFSKLHKQSREWLEEQVLGAREKTIVIFSHAPIKKRILKRLAKQKSFCEVVNISGHRHRKGKRGKENLRIRILGALYLQAQVIVGEIRVGEVFLHEETIF